MPATRRSDRRFDSQRTPFIWIKTLIFPSSLRFITDFISIRTLRQQIAQHVKVSSSGEFFSDAIRDLIRHSLICAGLFRDIICVRQWSIWQISLHQSQNEGDNSNWNDQSYPHLEKKIFLRSFIIVDSFNCFFFFTGNWNGLITALTLATERV